MITLLVIAIILSVIAIIISCFAFYAIWRFNRYISVVVEDKIEEHEERINTLHQSLSLAIGERLINPNGRIKRPLV